MFLMWECTVAGLMYSVWAILVREWPRATQLRISCSRSLSMSAAGAFSSFGAGWSSRMISRAMRGVIGAPPASNSRTAATTSLAGLSLTIYPCAPRRMAESTVGRSSAMV